MITIAANRILIILGRFSAYFCGKKCRMLLSEHTVSSMTYTAALRMTTMSGLNVRNEVEVQFVPVLGQSAKS